MDWLSSNALRRIGNPLRVHHPALYAALNAIRQRLLSRGSSGRTDQAMALRRFRKLCVGVGTPRVRRILEIGSDPAGCMLGPLAELADLAIGVNQDLPMAGRGALAADARALPFRDGSFDFIFSVATFEHVLELGLALDEMYRVLAPGGMVYSKFGPIWSAGKGHHVYAKVGEKEARHFKPTTNPLPDFIHLLIEREQLASALVGRVDPELLEPVVRWVFDDQRINRLFFHHYVRLFEQSRFSVVSLETEDDPVAEPLRRALLFKYPDEDHFEVTNVEVVLRREAES